MNTGSEEGWRIKVGACCFEDAKSALKLVKELTDTHIAELRGVLLEEEYLSGIELLPKQLVVTTSGSIEKIPSQKRINTIIAGEEAAFRDLLSKVSINLNWSFERRRGDLHSSILETDDGWDVLFVGCYELRKQTGEIVLIAPPQSATYEASSLAFELAQRLLTGIRVLTLEEDWIADSMNQAPVEHVKSREALLSRLSEISASAVVLDLSAGPISGREDMQRLFAAAGCPVVVFGNSGKRKKVSHDDDWA